VIPADVGPTVGLIVSVGGRQRHDLFGGAAHLIEDGCCILVVAYGYCTMLV
jgi:hypothetical protein